jgi:DNA replication protein DnaC
MAERFTKIDLVILEELGYLPFSPSGGALLFHLLSSESEREFDDHTSDRHFNLPLRNFGSNSPAG